MESYEFSIILIFVSVRQSDFTGIINAPLVDAKGLLVHNEKGNNYIRIVNSTLHDIKYF
ncbi:hypothetical protein PIROE2DRAFT_1707 [Piromyces sp. E2]|nr:hypothetical protein PIROE2DRAFT_1707 [Piromyces sp. E2]|eukprot:OUM70283.1 hypothetical protein PIROE2DRAFT_1707 [Piromyces sp. E2]